MARSRRRLGSALAPRGQEPEGAGRRRRRSARRPQRMRPPPARGGAAGVGQRRRERKRCMNTHVRSPGAASEEANPVPVPPCIDFHTHHVPARFGLTARQLAPPNQRARWDAIARRIADEDLLLQDIRAGDLLARVVSIPAQLIADAAGNVSLDTIRATNDALAALVARHPRQIYGLASVDAYRDETSAREGERAIRMLGLHGLFVECARGDLLIDAPQARPTLEVAARLGVPVFVHPVAPQPLTRQMAPYGVIGTLF